MERFELDFEEFSQLYTPGRITVNDLKSDSELFLMRIPNELVNPNSLKGTEISLKKKRKVIMLEDESLEITKYKNYFEKPNFSIFIPDSEGNLVIVNKEISAQFTLRRCVDKDVKGGTIDIDKLKAVHYSPSEDIHPRSFKDIKDPPADISHLHCEKPMSRKRKIKKETEPEIQLKRKKRQKI